jgi:hypothetical protein
LDASPFLVLVDSCKAACGTELPPEYCQNTAQCYPLSQEYGLVLLCRCHTYLTAEQGNILIEREAASSVLAVPPSTPSLLHCWPLLRSFLEKLFHDSTVRKSSLLGGLLLSAMHSHPPQAPGTLRTAFGPPQFSDRTHDHGVAMTTGTDCVIDDSPVPVPVPSRSDRPSSGMLH